MKRAILTVVNDDCNDVYSTELRTDRTYTIGYVDGEWVMRIEVGEHK